MGVGLRTSSKVMELPPNPKVNAPVLDPTCKRLEVKLLRPTYPNVTLPGCKENECDHALMKVILEKLKGGDFRSIGRSCEVVDEVIAKPEFFSDLFSGLMHSDPLD
jgi:hypothetical protein